MDSSTSLPVLASCPPPPHLPSILLGEFTLFPGAILFSFVKEEINITYTVEFLIGYNGLEHTKNLNRASEIEV